MHGARDEILGELKVGMGRQKKERTALVWIGSNYPCNYTYDTFTLVFGF